MQTAEDARLLLCELGDVLRDAVLGHRHEVTALHAVTGSTVADTIYAIDDLADDEVVGWFERRWPADEAVEVIAEGLDAPVVIGEGAPRWTVILDALDGTRGLMYDKRPGWVLAAAAPRAHGSDGRPRLRDIAACAMTEVTTTKQWASDQLSAVRACGRRGVVATRTDVRTRERSTFSPQPSTAVSLDHGWASFARFIPAAKPLLAGFEQRLWELLYGEDRVDALAIFDDQYLATGGQLHELMVGHDRMLGDLRPLAFVELGIDHGPAAHPYDCCTAMLATELGCVITDAWGDPLDGPLDTTSPVAWVGFANVALAERTRPALDRAIAECFPRAYASRRPSSATSASSATAKQS